MSIPREDVRFKLDHDAHAMLKTICEVDHIDINDFVEQALLPIIVRRVHDATILAERLAQLGISGRNGA